MFVKERKKESTTNKNQSVACTTTTTTITIMTTMHESNTINNNNNADDNITIEGAEPKMIVESWQDVFMNETPIFFQIIYMKPDVCWIWIGSQPPTFKILSLAMNTKYDKVPLVTDIIGWDSSADSPNRQIAQRLAMKYKNIVFYVSFNLENEHEKRVFSEKNIANKLKDVLELNQ